MGQISDEKIHITKKKQRVGQISDEKIHITLKKKKKKTNQWVRSVIKRSILLKKKKQKKN